jgi:hypothetical protein
VLADHTARQFEQWTVSCLTADGLVGQVGASVERGHTVDVGDVCAAGLSDGKGTGGKKPKKDPPGQGGGRG